MKTMMEDVHPLQVLTMYQSDVNSVDFAGDCILVTGSGDKRVRVWEWQTGTGYTELPYSPLMGHKYGVTCVKVSPQSTMLATSSIDGTTQLWNLRTGSKIHTMVQPGGESVRVCKFSPDSTFLVTSGDNGQVCLWDLVRRNLIRSFQQHEGAVQSCSFTPDSNWLLTTCTFGVLNFFSVHEIVDSAVTNLTSTINVFATVDDAHDLGVVSSDFSSKIIVSNAEILEKIFQLVTCGNDHYVKLWEVRVVQGKNELFPTMASLVLSKVLEKHSSALTCVRFNSSGSYIASSGLDKTTVIWETESGKMVSALVGHKRYVACCAFSRDGTLLATGSNDRSVIVWDLTGNNLTIDSSIVKHCSPTRHANNDNDNNQQEKNCVRYAETSENDVNLLLTLDDHGGAVNSVGFHGNQMMASASGDKMVRVWKIEEEKNEETMTIEMKFNEKTFSPIDGHKYSVNYVEFSPCGDMLASCSLDGTTMLWDTESGEQARGSFVNSGSGIRVCRWSPDSSKIATAGDDEKTTLWDTNTLEELKTFEGHADSVNALAFTPDSKYIVTACSEGTWRIFAVEADSSAIIVVDAHDLGVQGCDFSAASSPFLVPGMRQASADRYSSSYALATCGNDSLVKLWQIMIQMEESSDTFESDYSPDRSRTVSAISYRERRVLNGHGGNVMDVKFAPMHGEILGSVATDRTARLWSVNSGVCLHVLEHHESLVTCCDFSVWRLPQQLVSQSNLIDRLRSNKRKVLDWTTEDVIKWLNEINLGNLESQVITMHLSGRLLLSVPEQILIARLKIYEDEQIMELFKKHLYWLKKQDSNHDDNIEDVDIPHEFLCPITHEIMREPVKCSDGFIYEKAAINEWFLCGKYTSPMTNESLDDTSFTPAVQLRYAICSLLHGDGTDE
ncbi:hypothetical protein HCN44_002383 [Aphidius gifuensis]|uniref:WD repeat, SAM and U-box domain-containing protein 1 n=1 Tax=Aphidius gifuensis TaxID=684658 RepID=A0A835CUS0_APHGI|nr:hypothetical protein HCN44_002383 [Aphidius gifuensis]